MDRALVSSLLPANCRESVSYWGHRPQLFQRTDGTIVGSSLTRTALVWAK